VSLRPWRNARRRCAIGSGDARNPITGIAGCCARAASGRLMEAAARRAA
jgi:hypothetical protein